MRSTGKSPTLIPNDDPSWKSKARTVDDVKVAIPRGEMQMPAKAACSECPFSKFSTPGFLGGWDVAAYKPLFEARIMFPCHQTTDFADPANVSVQRHCTGLCHMRSNMELPFEEGSSIREAMDAAGKDPDFFETFEEFKNHHEPAKEG